MPMPKEKVYLMTSYRGYLAPLQMMGPINYPIETTKDIMMQLLNYGVPLVRYDPVTKRTVIITLENYENPFDTTLSYTGETPVVEAGVKGVRVNAPIEPQGISSEELKENSAGPVYGEIKDPEVKTEIPPEPEVKEEETSTEESTEEKAEEPTEETTEEGISLLSVSEKTTETETQTETPKLTKAQRKAARAAAAAEANKAEETSK